MRSNAFAIFAAAALLNGCGGSLPLQPVQNLVPLSAGALRPSWMSANAKKLDLLYVSHWKDNAVEVYNLADGTVVGRLTGFNAPYGQCVDAKGRVYVSNYTDGQVVEYAHAGTKPLVSWKSGGYPIGCSIDAKGDLAVTNYVTPSGSGDVCVFNHGSKKSTCYADSTDCWFLWPAGYDDKGDLVAIGKAQKHLYPEICGVPNGSAKMVPISYSSKLTAEGSVVWDGKYYVLPAEVYEYNTTTLAQATLSGSTLTDVSETTLSDTCEDDEVDVTTPVIVGKTNTLFNGVQGTSVVGGPVVCSAIGLGAWAYPSGGTPTTFYNTNFFTNGQSVSLAE